MSARKCCVRVELECSCERERLLGDTLCFLHHAQDELSGKQEPSLLHMEPCMGSYLHGEKTARWFQCLVQAACWHLPQWRDCRLTMLPYLSSCNVKLTTPCTRSFNTEMRLGVQLDDSHTFLSIKDAEAWHRQSWTLVCTLRASAYEEGGGHHEKGQ
ncbi:hypothetical protein ASZ78_013133 [Callipepla squamata]|uniref:Uncharacterized protein n=1 Tax=Callipepla squamata TaxID=9009 RepID=A0A226M8Z9_CALSU|nr:hypothetical protein ASZ78_013133 [Callipepla squamata]